MGDGRNRYCLPNTKKLMIHQKKKKNTIARWWEVLHSSQLFGPFQVDEYHPRQNFFGQHEQHLSHLVGVSFISKKLIGSFRVNGLGLSLGLGVNGNVGEVQV